MIEPALAPAIPSYVRYCFYFSKITLIYYVHTNRNCKAVLTTAPLTLPPMLSCILHAFFWVIPQR